MKGSTQYFACLIITLTMGCGLDEDDTRRDKGSLVSNNERGDVLPQVEHGELVYQRCTYFSGGMSHEEVFGSLTHDLEERAANPANFLGPDEPWIYSESIWTDSNEAGDAESCRRITRNPNPSYTGD
jgi:hypothetical protein